MELLNPKNDVVFQKLFGNNKNKRILISLLNSIICKANNEEIVDVAVEEKKMDISAIINEKISILDIYVTTNTNAHINVEMQIINEYNMIKRSIFYWSKMYLKQIGKGEEYDYLSKTITINLINYDLFENERFHNTYHLYEDKSKEILTDIMEIHFIEMKKFIKINKEKNNKLHRWLSFINNPNGEEVTEMSMIDDDIKEAKEILSLISGDEESRQLAEMREKAVLDRISQIEGAKRRAMAQGLKEGIEQGIEQGKIFGRREDILDNLKEIGQINQEVRDIINNETDLEILKLWLKKSMKANSIAEFIESIKK